ncbi:hypothetical protein LEP1GSC043_3798 [Leptospira weilii str. Ecochallenge]|uniref:Uncharacterized protein n=1 Tax=Leptospira weilii str. Ecochallenge TaxID=1049986 RepID=N1U747_9LEPT|nr:hypothetical protein LEP1GSC043_3798 [Leptospira weilii str. Ecochallenge]
MRSSHYRTILRARLNQVAMSTVFPIENQKKVSKFFRTVRFEQ